MLLPARIAQGVADGSIDLAFRRWQAARVRVGSTFTTSAGVIEITSLQRIGTDEITEDDARRAGFPTAAAVVGKLRQNDDEPAQLIHYHRPDEAGARESDYVLVPVEQPEKLENALTRALGVQVVGEKMRELYWSGRTRIHLDQVKGLGLFVELETVITDQSPEDAQAECERLQRDLGIQPDQIEPRSYADLLAEE